MAPQPAAFTAIQAAPDLAPPQREVARLGQRAASALTLALDDRARRLASLRTALGHLDPTQVLARGYSIVRDADGAVRRSSAGLRVGQPLDVTFSEGGAEVAVRKTR